LQIKSETKKVPQKYTSLFGFLKFENVEKDNPNSLLHVQREQKRSTKHYELFVCAFFKEKKEEAIL